MGIVYKELVCSKLKAKDKEDCLRKIGKILYDNGFVKDTYIDALLKREEIYPTGLNLKGISIAMPHTDRIHVNKAAIAIVILENTVEFKHMGCTGEDVNAEIIFMMAITDPNDQLENLKKVMLAFNDPSIVNEFKNAKTDEELYEIGKKYLD